MLMYYFVMDLKLYNRLIVIRDDLHDIEIPNVFFCLFVGLGEQEPNLIRDLDIFLHSCIRVIVGQLVNQLVSQ